MEKEFKIVNPEFEELKTHTSEQSWESKLDTGIIDEACSFVVQEMQKYYPELAGKTISDNTELQRAEFAAREIINNGLFRGNLEAGSASDPYITAKENIEQNLNLTKRKLTVKLIFTKGEYAICVHDAGKGFDPDDVVNAVKQDEHVALEHGRGGGIADGFGFIRQVVRKNGCTVILKKKFGVNPKII